QRGWCSHAISQLSHSFDDPETSRRSTKGRLVMYSSILKRVRVATMLLLVALLGFSVLAGNAWSATTGYTGGIPWQVGDVIICFGTPSPGTFGGACNVVRIPASGPPVLLDQFSDGLLGDTRGLTLDNTLHAVVTDDASSGSNVVVYSIASVNPDTSPTP